jgi:hypothetical protein
MTIARAISPPAVFSSTVMTITATAAPPPERAIVWAIPPTVLSPAVPPAAQ